MTGQTMMTFQQRKIEKRSLASNQLFILATPLLGVQFKTAISVSKNISKSRYNRYSSYCVSHHGKQTPVTAGTSWRNERDQKPLNQ